MRILLITDFSSIHVFNYISNVISKLKCECVGYHIVKDRIPITFLDYYKNNNIKVVQGVDPEIYTSLGAITFTKRSIRMLKQLGSFDVMHLHAVRLFVCPAIYIVRKRYSRIVITYWGSDLYRSSRLQLFMTLPILHSASEITMITNDMASYFKKLPWLISRYYKKVKVFDFGNMFYSTIQGFDKTKNNNKSDFGLNKNKIVCTIGYVWRPQMQQIKTVNVLIPFLKTLSDKVALALPVFGIEDKEYQIIDQLLKDTGIEYRLFRDFMDANTVSKFRSISDIFIHSQTTDALSCAMLEHLYAGSIVINGGWLKYSSLDENDIYYKSFSDFESLPNILLQVVDNIDVEREKCINNRIKVAKISSWDYLRQYWLELYKQ